MRSAPAARSIAVSHLSSHRSRTAPGRSVCTLLALRRTFGSFLCRGTSVRGTSVRGTSVRGTSVRGTSVRGTSVRRLSERRRSVSRLAVSQEFTMVLFGGVWLRAGRSR